MAEATLRKHPERALLHYFDVSLTGAELEAQADAFGAALAASGFCAGDRLVAQLPNMPQFVVALLAVWKLGGVLVTANPMYRKHELELIVRDCGARTLLTLEDLWEDVGRPACAGSTVRLVFTTSVVDGLSSPPPLFQDTPRLRADDARDFGEVIAEHRGQRAVRHAGRADDAAVVIYTSGTTGPPKGAVISHRNLVADAVLWPAWVDISAQDRIMGVAPLFHVTGLAANLAVCLLTGAPLVLCPRFDAAETLIQIERHQATFLIGAITAYTALMNNPTFSGERVASLRLVFSGGAPVAPAIVERWREATGKYIHNCYGLTETASLTHLVPLGREAPVDATSGALSIGIPVSETDVEIHSDDGQALPPGEIGEIVIGGPQVIRGYWAKPGETANALPDGRLRTGDVGFMDDNGWFYLVDRRKDLIVASGYKVWPREVEDVLVSHPAVREAAVIGIPDDYRGETVKAFVSLQAGAASDETALIGFCRERMAAYKYPRQVEVLDDLPKTPTGKILRRELRER